MAVFKGTSKIFHSILQPTNITMDYNFKTNTNTIIQSKAIFDKSCLKKKSHFESKAVLSIYQSGINFDEN